MALVPSLSVVLFHTSTWRAKAPWEQLPGGLIYQPALITKTEGQRALSLTDPAKNRYIFPQFSCSASIQVKLLKPDLALALTWWSVSFPSPNHTVVGNTTMNLQKFDDGWKIVASHTSTAEM